MTLTVTQDEHGLVGHYQLLPAFCQTEMPTADSYCPFTGANGQLSTLTVDDHSLRATGKDPFASQQDFSINLTSFDLTEVSVAAISADSGKLSVLADASK